MDEKDIIKRLQNGDITALEVVYNEYSGKIYSFSLSLCKSKETAEDVTADIFIMLYRYLSSGKIINNLKSFLFTAARNKIYDIYKISSRTEALPDDDIFFCDEPDNCDKIDIEAALEKLPPDEKEIVLFYCYGGLLHKEIASILNIPEGTVRWKYRNALSKLKALLGGADKWTITI
jgi:RNA polymerase sigma-70 factor (ECF subfamily)